MTNSFSCEKQFHLTPAVIEAKRIFLQQLPFDELAEIFRIQEGKDSVDPQPVVSEVNETDKNKLINSIVSYSVKNHHPIIEERHQFVELLYLIRKQHGNHYGFLQPDFICIIFGKMMVSKYQRSDADIQKAVNDWCGDPAKATAKYGHISKWNTSLVSNMKELFKMKRTFNDDISKWDVSSVTNMSGMFYRTLFDGDISGWDVRCIKEHGCHVP